MKRLFYLSLSLVNFCAGTAAAALGLYCTYIVIQTHDRRGWKVFVFFFALSFLFLHMARTFRYLAKLEEGEGIR